MQFPKHFFTFSALIPDYLQKDECVKMPSTCFVFVSQLYTWQREHGECCLTVFLTWAMVGAMVWAFFHAVQTQLLSFCRHTLFGRLSAASSPAFPSYCYVLNKHRWREVWDTTLKRFLPSPSKKGPCTNAWHTDHIQPFIICHFVVRKHAIICHCLK